MSLSLCVSLSFTSTLVYFSSLLHDTLVISLPRTTITMLHSTQLRLRNSHFADSPSRLLRSTTVVDSSFVTDSPLLFVVTVSTPTTGLAFGRGCKIVITIGRSHRKSRVIMDLDSTSRDVMKEFNAFQSKESLVVQKNQLELYLDKQKIDRTTNLDILAFWKANQFRYLELPHMARDVLSIPISTVALESAFNVGGPILDQYRSAPKLDVVEAIICCRDWLYGDKDLLELKLN